MNKEYEDFFGVNADGLRFCTGLSPHEFAKMRLHSVLNTNGFVINTLEKYSFFEYAFTDIKEERTKKNQHEIDSKGATEVVVYGPSFYGKTLYSYINEVFEKKMQGVEQAFCAIQKVHNIIEYFFKHEPQIFKNFKNMGPFAILIGEGADEGRVLFLPPQLLEHFYTDEKQFLIAPFVCDNKATFLPIDSWRFSIASYMYAVLSFNNAYIQKDKKDLYTDFYLADFIPLYYTAKVSISDDIQKMQAILTTIDENLSIGRHIKEIKKQESVFTKPLSFDKLRVSVREDSAEREQQKTVFLKKQRQKAFTHSLIQKHSTKIIVFIASLLLVIGITVSIVKTQLQRPTTKGMSAKTVVETLYNAVNSLDIERVDSCGKGARLYSQMVIGLTVNSKMRMVYEHRQGFFTPAQWLNLINPLEHSVFGVTDLQIVLNQKDESERLYTANFYIFNSLGDTTFELRRYTDVLKLQYKKDYWQIISIETDIEEIPLNGEDFKNSILIARKKNDLQNTQFDIPNMKQLLALYTWLPRIDEILSANKTIPEYLRVQTQ